MDLTGAEQARVRGVRAWPELLSVLFVGVLVLPWVWRYIFAYRLRGDDFALVLNSCTPYFDVAHWTTWFTQGYTDYFANYQGWPSIGTAFARPAVNAVFFAEGLLRPVAGDPVFLMASYATFLSCAAMVTYLLRRQTTAPAWVAVALGVAFGLSPIWYGALVLAGFLTNQLALAFVLASIVVLDPVRESKSWPRVATAVALQVLAVASHETAIVGPVVAVALLYALAPATPRRTEVLPFLAVPVYFAVERLVLPASGGAYVLRGLGGATVLKRLLGPGVGAFVPSLLPEWMATGVTPGAWDIVAIALASVAALGITVAFVAGFGESDRRRSMAMLAAVVAAFVPASLSAIEPRFRGIGFAVTLVALCFFARGRARRFLSLVTALVLVANLTAFWGGFVPGMDGQMGEADRAGVFFDATRAAAQRTSARTVVLVDDSVAAYGAKAMLELAAWPRSGVDYVVVNSYTGPPAADATWTAAVERRIVHVRVKAGRGQALEFPGAVPDFTKTANGLRYRRLDSGTAATVDSFEASGWLPSSPVVVVGIDPATGMPTQPLVF